MALCPHRCARASLTPSQQSPAATRPIGRGPLFTSWRLRRNTRCKDKGMTRPIELRIRRPQLRVLLGAPMLVIDANRLELRVYSRLLAPSAFALALRSILSALARPEIRHSRLEEPAHYSLLHKLPLCS